jgi:carboxyl-terminal processing protease
MLILANQKQIMMLKKLFILSAIVVISFVSIGQTNVNDAAKKFETLLKVVDRNYVDSINHDKLIEFAIEGMLKEMDPHSVYISKDELQKMNEPLVGNFEGVGIQFNILHDTIMVVSPIVGGPSEALGILSGDRIVTIEGELMAGIGVKNQDVMDRLRGKKGTQVKIEVARRGVKNLIEFTITRDKIPIYSVDAVYMARPEIGYIKVSRFAATTMDEMVAGIEKLQKEGMKHLILDLRGNGGGYLNIAVKMADEFLSARKLIVYTEGRSFPKDEHFATSIGSMEKGKLVVLINEGSASASEIVAGAIQDHDRGLIIGRRSFGKGLVQKPYNLPDGSVVRLTISRYYTPSGRSIQKSYEDGEKNYKNDLQKRYEKGELMSADSISFPEELKKTTANGRTVYGGGGIMPDIFIPLDTTGGSKYYTDLSRKGIFNRFSLDYMDLNRKEILKKYKNVNQFNKEFEINQEFLKEFFDYAEKEGVPYVEDDYQISKKFIDNQLKALIARGAWNSEAYYQITNEINDMFLKSIEVMKDDTFKKMNIQE